MNEILQWFSRLPPEIDHLTKLDKNNKFKMAAAAIFEFHLSFITRLLLHIFAQNLARVLRWRSYMQVCQNIEQKSKMAAAAILDFCTNSNTSAAD